MRELIKNLKILTKNKLEKKNILKKYNKINKIKKIYFQIKALLLKLFVPNWIKFYQKI